MEAIEQGLPWDGPIIRYNLIRRKSIPRHAGEALLIVLCMPAICLWIIYELQIGDRILVLRSWFKELEEQAEYIRDQERMYLEWEKDYYQRVVLGVVPPPADGSTWESMPVIYGYARVSSKGHAKDGNRIEAQTDALTAAGAAEVYTDVYTGTTTDR